MDRANRRRVNGVPKQFEPIEPTRQMHRQYLKFMQVLATHVACPVQTLDWDEFCQWWAELDPKTRDRCWNDFQKGYEQVVAEAELEVAEAIRKYKMPVN